MLEPVEDLEHHFALLWRDLLRVPGVGHGLTLIIFQANVTQLRIRHILHINPLNLELAFELVLDPDGGSGVAVVHTAQHFSHATKMSRAVDREEQEDGALPILGLEGRVQPFVAVICGAPDLVFDTSMDVIFTEALDDKVPGVLGTQIKALGIVVIGLGQVLQHWMRHRVQQRLTVTPVGLTS